MRALVVIVALVACDGDSEPPARPVATPAAPVGESTIARRDYIGPTACGDCHPDEYARWSNSLHRKMNQTATPDAVIGDFANTTLAYAGGEVRFTHDPSGYAMTLAKAGTTTRYRITRTIGVRGLQEYVGSIDGGPEVRLPFAWWPRRAGWFPQPYFDPWLDEATFDPYAAITDPWATRCPWCHSTYPFAQRIARANARPVGHGLEQFYIAAAREDPDRLRVDEQVTTGISCESCHLGGRAHAAGAPIHLVPGGATALANAPHPTKFADEARDPAIVNATCAQCHSGPTPRLPDGSALRNSSEALDLAASSCRGIRCTDCHDPHRADARADATRAIAACTRCHTSLADPKTATIHAGHTATTTCLDCHMPRFVLGIDGFVRSHRISSPTDRKMLAAAAPNACNLCHLDRPIDWTLDELARGWGARVGTVDRSGYRGSVGETWLASESAAIRLIAIGAYGRTHDGANLPRLVAHLADREAYVRAWTTFAIDDLLAR